MPETAVRDAAKAALVAWDDDSFTVGGYLVVWDGRDLAGDRFTRETDLWIDTFAPSWPVFYQHGRDPVLGKAVIGKVVQKRADDVGLWVEAQIATANEYAAAIRELVRKGVLGWSSGAVNYLVERAADKTILSWPIIEATLTPTPCEPRTLGVRELKALVADVPGFGVLAEEAEAAEKATPSSGYDVADNPLGASRSEFAYVDSAGRGHLPIHDEAHVRAALGRFTQTAFEDADAKRRAAKRILAAARRFGIDVAPDSAVAQAAGESKAATAATTAPTIETEPATRAGRPMRQSTLDRLHTALDNLHSVHDATCDMGADCPMANAKSSTPPHGDTAAQLALLDIQNTLAIARARQEV
jgi:hypothetical protein